MSKELLVDEAKRRAKIFKNLDEYLKKVVEAIEEIDGNAEVYLFGSVAEKKHLLSSDIDILVVTSQPPGEVQAKLWREGFGDPFEIHVATRDMLQTYRKRAKLVKLK